MQGGYSEFYNDILVGFIKIFNWFSNAFNDFLRLVWRGQPLVQTAYYVYWVIPCLYFIFDFILFVAFNDSHTINLKFNITRKVFNFYKNQKEKRERYEFSLKRTSLSSDLSTWYYFKPGNKKERQTDIKKYVPRNKEGKQVNIDVEPD